MAINPDIIPIITEVRYLSLGTKSVGSKITRVSSINEKFMSNFLHEKFDIWLTTRLCLTSKPKFVYGTLKIAFLYSQDIYNSIEQNFGYFNLT